MIVNAYPEARDCSHQLPRCSNIRPTWLRVTARVIVREDQRLRVASERLGDNLSHRHRNPARKPVAMFGQADNFAIPAQEDDPQRLDVVARHTANSADMAETHKPKLSRFRAVSDVLQRYSRARQPSASAARLRKERKVAALRSRPATTIPVTRSTVHSGCGHATRTSASAAATRPSSSTR